MATPKPRYDSYATPLAPLVDARTELLYERAFNQVQRHRIAQVLDEKYHALLRRGTFAEVVIRLTIKDGVLAQDIHAIVDERVRTEAEDGR